jgi:hypothetical protein
MVSQTIISQKDLSSEFDKATNELMQLLIAFGQQQINTKPPDGGWTAAMVGEHLFKSDSAILKALYGPVKDAMRTPDKHVNSINRAFLDFSTKMKSPDLIIPEDIEHDKEAMISALKSTRDLLGKAIKTLDLSPICTDPDMSGLVGEWTRQEYINFVISHTHRHIHQLKKIFNKTQ